MGSRAIYSVIENGRQSHFYTQWGANQYLPFVVLKSAKSLSASSNGNMPLSEIMPELFYNHFMHHDTGFDGYVIFEKLTDKRSGKILSDFCYNASVNMHVTLDIDHDRAYFEYNPLSYTAPVPSDFSVDITEGLHCLEEVINEAAQEDINLSAVIEGKMMNRLRKFTGQNNQQNMSF